MKYFDLPPIWLMGFAALAWATARLGFGFAVPHWGHWAAGGIIVVSVGVMAAAVVAMLRHKTTVIPHQQPSTLVKTGVFRLSRNPIYLADVFTLAGVSILCGSWTGLVLVPVLVVVLQKRFIEDEEKWLRARFEEEFVAWSGNTRRWL
nr:methyltransferase [uncultured Celeribacter sp.]